MRAQIKFRSERYHQILNTLSIFPSLAQVFKVTTLWETKFPKKILIYCFNVWENLMSWSYLKWRGQSWKIQILRHNTLLVFGINIFLRHFKRLFFCDIKIFHFPRISVSSFMRHKSILRNFYSFFATLSLIFSTLKIHILRH